MQIKINSLHWSRIPNNHKIRAAQEASRPDDQRISLYKRSKERIQIKNIKEKDILEKIIE